MDFMIKEKGLWGGVCVQGLRMKVEKWVISRMRAMLVSSPIISLYFSSILFLNIIFG